MRPQSQEKPSHRGAQALVVLGCRVHDGRPGAALLRRLRRAEQVHREMPALAIIMSGGQRWQGHTEARVMSEWWTKQGLPFSSLHEEGHSLTTEQNADKVAVLCKQLRYRHIVLITCDFHMNRARRLFRLQGLNITEAAACHERNFLEKLKVQGREQAALLVERLRKLLK